MPRQASSFAEKQGRDVEVELDFRPPHEIQHELIQERGLEDGTYDLLLCLSDWVPFAVEADLPGYASK